VEGRETSDLDPRKQIRLEHQAKAFTDLLQYALQFNALLAQPENSSDTELRLKAEEFAQAAIHDSYLDVLPFNFLIKLPRDNPGTRSIGMKILEENVFEFEASEVRRLDTEQVDFHNIRTDEWLTIFKHRIDKITPILP
jgi:hypothetical protein